MAQPETSVSVVIPVFEGERYLAKAIESVLSQTRRVSEIVVVDDGSTDGSAQVAQSFGETVQYRYQEHAGAAAARNRGIEMASGEFLAFLDADDVWVKEKIEKQLAAFEDDPALEMVFGGVKEFHSPELDESITSRLWANPNVLRGYNLGAMLIRRNSFWRVGLLDTRWQISEFIDWYPRARDLGLRERMLPDLVMWRRLHQTNNGIRMRAAREEYALALKAIIQRRRKGEPREAPTIRAAQKCREQDIGMSRYYHPRFLSHDLPEAAAAFNSVLRDRMLPYWRRTVLDRVHGGYELSDRYRSWETTLQGARYRLTRIGRGQGLTLPIARRPRHIVSQMRMLWSFAHAHCHGYSDAEHDYLQAAAHGYDFLIDRMWDSQHGGAYWRVSPTGQVLDSRKMIFGQGYVIFALIEYYRASGLAEPRERAMSLFRLVQEKMRDEENGGWTEHAARDFGALPFAGVAAPGSFIEKVGLKSSYAMMHWLEALTELYQVTRNAEVRASLEEAVRISATKFNTLDVTERHNLSTPDWQPVAAKEDEAFSPGHELEQASLLLRAQGILGVPLSLDRLEIFLNHAVKFACDRQRGGFFQVLSSQPFPAAGKKTWWVQAEALCALTDASMHDADAELQAAALRHLSWIWNYQMLADGVWIWSTDARGDVTNWVKADEWKEPYHETRALIKFIRAFAPVRQPSLQVERPRAA